MSERAKCDFCSSNDVRWRYPAESFDAPEDIGAESVGAWSACDTCHDLIERGDRAALNERGLATVEPMARSIGIPLDLTRMLPWIRKLHDGFFTHRTGPATAVPR